MKKLLTKLALGAGLMWFADPQNGAKRRTAVGRATTPVRLAFRKVTDRAGVHNRAGKPANSDVSGDPTTVTQLVDLAKVHGIDGTMSVSDDAEIVCQSCGTASVAGSVTRLWLHRLEGASDPDDMSTVSALRCPSCGVTGLLITPYGPNASVAETEVILGLPTPESADMAPFLNGTVSGLPAR